MELKGLVYAFILFSMAMNLCGASRLSHFDKRSPVKSFQRKNGDVIDCMDFSHQPAFEHPILKNHKIQMRPSSFPEEAENIKSNEISITELWPTTADHGSCPEGTVPVIRTKDEHGVHSASSSLQSFGMMSRKLSSSNATSASTTPDAAPFSQYAAITVGEGEYYGAKATMNIWEPHVQLHEFSSSALSLYAGSGPNLNAIIVGWRVSPSVYGDNRSRFTISWTRDSFGSTGCTDLHCPGFVQLNNQITIGAPFPLLSTLNSSLFEISIVIWKTEEAWWIKYNNAILGYWPLSLFSELANSASQIGWAGSVLNSRSDGRLSTTTEMGSGHFPEEGIGRASYMRQLNVFDETLTLKGLNGSPRIFSVQNPNCYNITFGTGKSNLLGDFILYGGPGRNPKCP